MENTHFEAWIEVPRNSECPNEAILVTAKLSFLSPYHAIKQLHLMALFHPEILPTSRLTSNELDLNILAKISGAGFEPTVSWTWGEF